MVLHFLNESRKQENEKQKNKAMQTIRESLITQISEMCKKHSDKLSIIQLRNINSQGNLLKVILNINNGIIVDLYCNKTHFILKDEDTEYKIESLEKYIRSYFNVTSIFSKIEKIEIAALTKNCHG
jgi:hypothetical protein